MINKYQGNIKHVYISRYLICPSSFREIDMSDSVKANRIVWSTVTETYQTDKNSQGRGANKYLQRLQITYRYKERINVYIFICISVSDNWYGKIMQFA